MREEAPGVVSVYITGRDLDQLRAEPGQFFRWRFLTRELWWQSHPYSLSAMPQPDLMRITVKARGDHSGSLAQPAARHADHRRGTLRRVHPLAHRAAGAVHRRRGRHHPDPGHVRRAAPADDDGITLIYRASHPRDVVFSRELNAIASDRKAALHYLIGARADLGYDPLDADHLQHATVPGLHRYEAYVCGPTGMTQTAVASLRAAGVPAPPHPPRVVRLLKSSTLQEFTCAAPS